MSGKYVTVNYEKRDGRLVPVTDIDWIQEPGIDKAIARALDHIRIIFKVKVKDVR